MDEFKPRPSLRIVIITGGALSGKSFVAKRLFGQLPEAWKIVPLDNHIPTGLKLQRYAQLDWKLGAVLEGAAAVGHWREAHMLVLVEGVADEQAAGLIAQAFGTSITSPDCAVIQLQRTRKATGDRVAADPSRLAEYTERGLVQALDGLESQVPAVIPGAVQIQTDGLSREEVLGKVKAALS